jgi:transglutaminase-like putative cysteine protease
MYRYFLLVVFILMLNISCFDHVSDPSENHGEIFTDTLCKLDYDQLIVDFDIDYSSPDSFLLPGAQSTLDSASIIQIQNIFSPYSSDLLLIRTLCQWVNQNYTWENAGGSMVGKVTAQELYTERKLYGCHSAALLISSMLRYLGFPVVMVETASVDWAYDYKQGKTQNFIGHVMNEVYVDEQWILLDNNGQFTLEYDVTQPYIYTSTPQIRHLFVVAKGFDTLDYYEKMGVDTGEMLLFFSDNIYCYVPWLYSNKYHWSQ